MVFTAAATLPLPLHLRPLPPSIRPSQPRFLSSLPSLPLLKSHHHPVKPLKRFLPPAPLLLRRHSPPSAVSDSSHRPSVEGSSVFQQWDSLTAKFAGAANVPFLLLQLPQIVLNARNLLAGNKAALFAVPWLGMLTGLLGNLSLLSYFAKKKETEAVLIQTLGVLSNYVVIAQLAMAEAMPLPQFALTSAVVASGLVLNFFNYFGWLHDWIWRIWEDFITIGGVAVLPQVMWSTFLPYIPNSILPGLFSGIIAVVAVIMARTGKLSDGGIKFVGSISGWTATLLFMWMPVAQMWTNYLHPDNIKGLSAFTMLLAMIGNGLMIPRALFIRDLMWFTGSAWATFLLGWGNLACMYCFNSISREFFFAATLGLFIWLGMAFWRDMLAYGYDSPMTTLKELVFGP
ncbi:maltose excess protein 1-like, chloroplastic [Elaeis guineensis]|uniref:Maltose excess protein 1-like, chloroplastic n=1 Tax=Elaeis guineensis var. tenera TaxID=51953 RepID=A0A6I9SHI5_ELAGV|nr:maltose excess protein 1-like, chloroplastic [Elaeis guineensis]